MEHLPLLTGNEVEVLVIEDNPVDVLVLEKRLERTMIPCTIKSTASIKKAHQMIDSADIVFLDLHLEMGNPSIEESINFIKDHQDKKIVVVSADDKMETVIRCFKEGAFEYITKPVLQSDLLRRLLRYANPRVA